MIKNPKQRILVAFSGGETSAYMINWLLLNRPNHEYKFVFANTGEEREETLIFVKNVQEYFNIDVVWVEYENLSFKIVNFETAYRSHNPVEIENKWQNHPFRKYISKFGIPNLQNNSCSRDLKHYPIDRYMKSIGWKPKEYDKAIGIRADEIDRIGAYYYPLIIPNITKPIVNAFWDKMPFRLGIKGYEGNCKTCWKKSFRKLSTIALENPNSYDFFKQMELEYRDFVPKGQIKRVIPPNYFFRQNKTVEDIFEMSKHKKFEKAKDDSKNINYQTSILHDGTELDISNGCVESCEVFI
jgi:hypothetical protein